jgi:hypothetical protein
MWLPDILMLLLFNSLYVLGFYLAIQPDMIGWPITKYGSKLGKWFNPIGGCVTCMASMHSWPYLLAFGLDWVYIPYVFALASLNTIIYNRWLS